MRMYGGSRAPTGQHAFITGVPALGKQLEAGFACEELTMHYQKPVAVSAVK